MAETARHDAWQAGDAYDNYMGRWSRLVAPRFLERLSPAPALDWLEVGCGTGALSAAILSTCAPKSLVAIDPSDGFVAKARENVKDGRVSFAVGDAQSLSQGNASRDIVVAALVLNFVPDRPKALAEMKRVLRPGGTLGFYVWDYPAGGVEFMRAFWKAATALDPKAAELNENRRFPFCTADGLSGLVKDAGFTAVSIEAIEVPTVFKDFDDYWRPFTLGAGPAPGYCAALPPEAREALKRKLQADLPSAADGSITMKARAWALSARA